MASSKEVRRRIKSATNTKQIIKAMELVSVVKMQKAVAGNFASRFYSQSASDILEAICADGMASHAYMATKEKNRKLIVLITSDRGLCGGLNIKAIKKALEESRDAETADFVTIGRKGRDFLRGQGFKIIAEFNKVDDQPTFSEIMPIITVVTQEFLDEKYDKVVVIYSHFESSLSQVPTALELLPFKAKTSSKTRSDEISFEPEKEEILNALIPRILEIKVWQALQEAIASEHSARMVAMKNANENAEELISDLTLTYNQTRQAGITQEIAEISAGKMTLEG